MKRRSTLSPALKLYEALRIALLVPIFAVWACHLYQRRFAEETGGKKRTATLAITVILLGVWAAAFFFGRLGLDWVFMIPVVLIAAGVVYVWRKTLFPYRLTCVKCGTRLRLKEVLFLDANMCGKCTGQIETKGDES
jgi:hypothetical protein